MKVCSSCQAGHVGEQEVCVECGESLEFTPPREGNDLCGAIIDEKFALAELLGEGGMAWVYRAVHVHLNRTVILKILKTKGVNEFWVRSFNNEVRALSGLNHPHIVSVMDAGQSRGGFFYFVTEFIPGQTLHELLYYQSEMPLRRAIGIMHQVMAAVEEAHAMNVIHRDLKPANILVSELRSGEDFIKVFDFGIAVLKGESSVLDDRETFCGTAGYVAPECISGQEASETSDIYALGVVFYQMLVGAEPFESENTRELLHAQLEGKHTPPSIAAKSLHLPQSMDSLLEKALSPDPQDRYQSVLEFRQALVLVTRELGRFKLRCDKCTRPVDPSTGLCDLHRTQSKLKPPSLPRESDVESVKQTTNRLARVGSDEQDSEWVNLVEIVTSGGRVGSKYLAEGCVEFLLGDDRILEILGSDGSDKGALAGGLHKAASSFGLGVCSIGTMPTMVSEPWGQARKVVAAALGIDARPANVTMVRDSMVALGATVVQTKYITEFFGFLDYKTSSRPNGFTASELISAAVNTVAMAGAHKQIDAVFAADLGRCDFASRDFIRALLGGGSPWKGKLIITGNAPFFSGVQKREEIRLESRAPTENVSKKLLELPEEAMEVYYLIALIGTDVKVDSLKLLTDPDQVFMAVEILIQAGLASPAPGHCVVTSNPLAANQSLNELSEIKRKGLNTRIFDVLKTRDFSVFGLGEFAQRIGRFDEALSLFEKAGDRAVKWLDFETAALIHYRRAIHMARWRLEMPDDHGDVLALSLKQGSALMMAGHSKAAELVFREILKESNNSPLVSRQARAGIEAITNQS